MQKFFFSKAPFLGFMWDLTYTASIFPKKTSKYIGQLLSFNMFLVDLFLPWFPAFLEMSRSWFAAWVPRWPRTWMWVGKPGNRCQVAVDFFFPKDFVASNLCFLGAMDCLWQWEYIMFFFQTVQQKLKWPEKIFTSFPILFPCRGIEKRVGFDKKHPWLWWWGLALNLSFDSHEVPARRYERSKLVKSLRRPVPPLELCRFEWMIAW